MIEATATPLMETDANPELVSALKSQQDAQPSEEPNAQEENVTAETFLVRRSRNGDRCGALRKWSSSATVIIKVPSAPQRKSVAEQLLDEEAERRDHVVRRKR